MENVFSDKWTKRFMDLCTTISFWSKDPSTKVGAVIVDNKKRIVSVGYNGFPRGVSDDEERYQDREVKYTMVSHAERNALDNSPTAVEGATMFVTLMPCSDCAKSIIQRGIKTVIVPPMPRYLEDYDWEKDFYNWKVTQLMFKEAGIQVIFS